MIDGRIPATLGDEVVEARVPFSESIGIEFFRRAPGARVMIGTVQVEENARASRKFITLPVEVVPRPRHDEGEEGVKASHLLRKEFRVTFLATAKLLPAFGMALQGMGDKSDVDRNGYRRSNDI